MQCYEYTGLVYNSLCRAEKVRRQNTPYHKQAELPSDTAIPLQRGIIDVSPRKLTDALA